MNDKPDVSTKEMLEWIEELLDCKEWGWNKAEERKFQAIRSVLTSTPERGDIRGKRTDAPEVADCHEDIQDLVASEVWTEGEPGHEEYHLSVDGETRLRLLLTGLWNSAALQEPDRQDARGEGEGETRQVGIVFKCKACGRELEAFRKPEPEGDTEWLLRELEAAFFSMWSANYGIDKKKEKKALELIKERLQRQGVEVKP